MSIIRPHQYAETVAGSNYAPFPIDLRDVQRGTPLDLTGAEVTFTIIDEDTGEVIVKDGVAVQNEENPYWVEYYLTEEEAAKITRQTTWIGWWKITSGSGRVHNHPVPCRIPVRPAPV